MFENLDTEYRIKRTLVEGQLVTLIQIIGTRASEFRSRSFKCRLVFDAQIFVDMGAENALELLLPAADIEQLSTGS